MNHDVVTNKSWKRKEDILIVLIFIPFAIIISIPIYLWIKVVSKGPAIFCQQRIGLHGEKFRMYKFRTMSSICPSSVHKNHVNKLVESNDPMIKMDYLKDPRLIRGGWLIRMSGLDEIPQLINVIFGEMSIVGPRPCIDYELIHYDLHNQIRFKLKPGMTGLWQVSRNSHTTFKDMMRMDAEYIKKITLVNDLKILLRTPNFLLRQISVCVMQRWEKHTNDKWISEK